MAKRMIADTIVEVGRFPVFARNLGFRNSDEVTRIASKFGKIVARMNYDDIIKWFEEGNR